MFAYFSKGVRGFLFLTKRGQYRIAKRFRFEQQLELPIPLPVPAQQQAAN